MECITVVEIEGRLLLAARMAFRDLQNKGVVFERNILFFQRLDVTYSNYIFAYTITDVETTIACMHMSSFSIRASDASQATEIKLIL